MEGARLGFRGIGLLCFFVSCLVRGDIPSTHVRVRLGHTSFPFQVLAPGISIRGLKTPSLIQAAIPKNQPYNIKVTSIHGQDMWMISSSKQKQFLNGRYLELTSVSSALQINGYSYPSPTLITLDGDIISSMPLEEYLTGVLAGEMPASWPLEALKAQAIAARSYAVFQMDHRQNSPFQLDGTILDQVFKAEVNEAEKDKISLAVEQTSGQLLREKGKIVKAYYHSDCGGVTESPEEIWGGHSKGQQPILDRRCAFNPSSQWRFEISFQELSGRLKTLGFDFSLITSITISKKTTSGRAALISFSDGHFRRNLSGNDLRQLLGFNRLKSTLFSIEQLKSKVIFSGRGFGHGSGLCQWGTKYLAQEGYSAFEILKHYYPLASLSEVDVANR